MTELYGLVEGFLGTHEVKTSVKETLAKLPNNIRIKCTVEGNKIRAYSACDG